MTKKELKFRKYLRSIALYYTYEWEKYYVHKYNDHSTKFPIFKGLYVENLYKLSNKFSYKKVLGLFRKTYLKQFDYILTDTWEDLEYKFAYNHISPCIYYIRNGEWIHIKGDHDTIFFKPVYKQRDLLELIDIGMKNKEWHERWIKKE